MHASSLIILAIASTLFTLPAIAQPTSSSMAPATPSGAGRGMGRPADCSKAADPAQCEARRAAHEQALAACRDRIGGERRQCMHQHAQQIDCARARVPQQCEARKRAYAACQELGGPDFKRCVQEKMPTVDCSQAADPARCQRHQKARELCRDKLGPEHRQCLRDTLATPAR
jgi:hypothetical protein